MTDLIDRLTATINAELRDAGYEQATAMIERPLARLPDGTLAVGALDGVSMPVRAEA